jgi:hypothetical protein
MLTNLFFPKITIAIAIDIVIAIDIEIAIAIAFDFCKFALLKKIYEYQYN